MSRSLAFRPAAARSNYARRPVLLQHPATISDSVLFVGGLLLLGLGLAAGLTIGGWLGLLVGLVLGIPGYLLLGRGYAGSWKAATPRSKRPARRRSAAPFMRGGDLRDLLSLLALGGGIALWVIVGGWAGAGLFVLSLLVILGIMIWGFGQGDMP